MNPIQFRHTLNEWSQADNPEDLIKKVLKDCPGPLKIHRRSSAIKNKSVAEQISKRIQNFLKDNENQIISLDLPALEGLQALVNKFTCRTTETLRQDKCGILKKTVTELTNDLKAAIELSKGLAALPDILFSLTTEYLSIEDCINLAVGGRAPSPTVLARSINAASDHEINLFTKNVIQRFKSDPSIAQEMIYIFFKYASEETQSKFFRYNNNQRDAISINDVISSVPNDLIHFNLFPAVLQDHHVENIARRLNSLQSLAFQGSQLTDSALMSIANNPNMAANLQDLKFCVSRCLTDNAILAALSILKNLTNLDLCHCNLTHAAVAGINDLNLKSLNLSSCYGLTDKAIAMVFNDQYQDNLQDVNFANCKLTDASLRWMAKVNMASLKKVNFNGCDDFTDAGILEFINTPSLISLQSMEFSHSKLTDATLLELAGSNKMSDLQNADFSWCQHLTDVGILAFMNNPNMPNLQNVSFARCSGLTDTAVLGFIDGPNKANLLSFDVLGCPKISKAVKERLEALLKENALHRQSMLFDDS